MKEEIQLSLDAFDPGGYPLCSNNPSLNGFKRLCHHCPHATRESGSLFCTLHDRSIGTREKYALTGWKRLRKAILERDGEECVICGTREELHIHHIDGDNTRDDPGNLVTLCEYCHARAHQEMQRIGGAERAAQAFHRSLSAR